MGAVQYRVRAELRRRWRPALLLVAIIGIAGAVVLTTLAGARRSSTAYDRFRDETLAGDLDVSFEGPPTRDVEGVAAAMQEVPAVEALTQLAYPFVVPAGSGFYPYLDFLAAAPVDQAFGVTVERPRLISGRLPDPSEPSEAAITETFAHEADLSVGDELALESYSEDQFDALFTTGDAGPPAGPDLTVQVVGVFSAPTFLSESTGSFQPRMFLTSTFLADHRDEIATYPGGFIVRLRNGSADVPAASKAIRELLADATLLELTPSADIDDKIASSIDVIVNALLLCALVALVAGAVAITQALARFQSAEVSTERSLAALGMTRGERRSARVATTVPIALVGALIAVALAVAASAAMPVGVARRAEPDPGVDLDIAVLGVGFLVVVLGVLGMSTIATLAVDRRVRLSMTRSTEIRPSRSLQVSRRAGLPPSATIGVSMAIDPRWGTGLAVRSALGAVALGTSGIVMVGIFVASVDTLASSPARYGSPFDGVASGFTGDVLTDAGDELLADPEVAQLSRGESGVVRIGDAEMNGYAMEPLKGGMSLTVLDGRTPEQTGEVALGTATLGDLDLAIGDTVVVDAAAGSVDAVIVGTAVFPIVDERSAAGRGALLDRQDLVRISSPRELNHDVAITWADGVDVDAANEALAERTGTEVFGPRIPSDVNNLREVRALPRALAGFLALLAILAALHALVSTAHVRRHDFAVLHTLGFRRGQLAATTSWQATTIALVGLLVGVPLGLALGRIVWEAVAANLGVVDDPVIPSMGVAIVCIATVVAVNLIAIPPGRVARGVRPASVLRAG